jgi:hypothetical protein
MLYYCLVFITLFIWKSGKQCVIFAAALQERPMGLERNSKAVFFWNKALKSGVQKKTKINFGKEKYLLYLCTRF